MTVCGNGKSILNTMMYSTGSRAGHRARAWRGNVSFEYTGDNALTVIGRGTRCRYIFRQPGHVLSVDVRDAQAMLMVPHLRRG